MTRYEQWTVRTPDPQAHEALSEFGLPPVIASVLSARGMRDAPSVKAFLSASPNGLFDPMLLPDMDKAVRRLRLALERGEHIAVFGDYDVDGITSVCLLTRYLRGQNAHCVYHIPDRFEEGYGLNESALRSLREDGVSLVVTVDAGITAVDLAELCKQIGLDLIITDHHHCPELLPDAVAVVNPYRPDSDYPFVPLAGVGVAFKLVCAMTGNAKAALEDYAELVALGTLADIMPVTGENRVLVSAGLNAIRHHCSPGLNALLREASALDRPVNAALISFVLAPRINAAGRLGNAEQAVRLLLTEDAARAAELAHELCELNIQRQALENAIMAEALAQLPAAPDSACVVLCGENWHSGVVGIVSSRLVNRFHCPAFLICMDADTGKGSARSIPGVHLVDVLRGCADLLDHFGGHELAAGFSLPRKNLAAFAARVEQICAALPPPPPSQLLIDAALSPALLTLDAALSLNTLEPFGLGNPQPLFVLENAVLSDLVPIGGGKHMRAKLLTDEGSFQAVWFGADVRELDVREGDCVDVAFHLEINYFRHETQLQLHVADLRLCRPAHERRVAQLRLYHELLTHSASGDVLAVVPSRGDLAAVWRALRRVAADPLSLPPLALARTLVPGVHASQARTLLCLEVFAELGLVSLTKGADSFTVCVRDYGDKADLDSSALYRYMCRVSEGD